MNKKEVIEKYIELSNLFLKSKSEKELKDNSQYFTSLDIADIMVEDITISQKEEIKILEPSCGCGILILKIIEKIVEVYFPKKIKITAYDIDYEALEITKELLSLLDIEIELKLENKNFLEENIEEKYDFIISNPPYKKTNISKIPQELIEYVNGQPNLYHLFIAKSLKLLENKGVLVFISPKNYLSGKYTEKLRKEILDSYSITKIHTFNERNKFFGLDVLQEVCITHIKNQKESKVELAYNNNQKFMVNISEIVNGEKRIILTPRKREELNLIKNFKKIGKLLKETEIVFKVGKVVQFRVNSEERKLENFEYVINKDAVPLIVYRHINLGEFKYRTILEKKKNQAISIIDKGNNKNIYEKNGSFLFLRKAIDKRSDKLLFTVPYHKNLKSKWIAIDNGICYFTDKEGDLDEEVAKGLYCVLNSLQFDNYYRMFSSSHTINCYEIETMYFPEIEILKRIGEKYNYDVLTEEKCTEIISKMFMK